MECAKFKKYLFLEESELTEKERTMLNEHLKVCQDCSSKRTEFDEYYNRITELRSKVPVLKNGEELTNDIIRIINNKLYSKGKGFLENLTGVLSFSSVRYSLIIFMFLIMGSFFAEVISTSEDISKLEAAMSIQSSSLKSSRAEFLNGDYLLSRLNDAKELLEGNKSSIELPAGWMLLKKSEIIKLLISYDELDKILNKYPDIDLSDYPLLSRINIHKMPDEKELELLLSNSKELENEINKLKEREK